MTNAFFVINFIVSFFSDIILNVLSRLKKSPVIIQSLKPYFEKNNFIITAIYAGLTILCALFVNSLITYYVFDFYYPTTNAQALIYLIIAMPLGYFFDVIIYKCKIFGNLLDPYYKLAGPGLWGMVAYIFSILTSFLLFTNFHFKN